jgi:hypothetical protein
VHLVQVEVVGTEPAQRCLHGPQDVPAGAPRAVVRTVGAGHVHAELGGEHRLVAPSPQRRADQLLRGAVRAAVDVGRVEQVDPEVECGMDHRAGTVRVHPAPEVVAAEPDHRDHQPGTAQPAVAHVCHATTVSGGG